MKNMSLTKNPMPTLSLDLRKTTFDEVALGYTPELAIDEARRCLGCKNKPCVSGCPVGIRIPDFIAKVAEGDFEAAYGIIYESSSLPAVCGRVCPQETQCESKCVRSLKVESVAIGRLERFVADYHNQHSTTAPQPKANTGHKVAVVGAGPAGLTCAGDLSKQGHEVVVFEALHKGGGVLTYGIPEFRLPKSIVEGEIRSLEQMGVKMQTNVVIGKTLTVDELLDGGFEAIFLGTGAGLPAFLGIEGESLCGVYSANEYLTRANLAKAYMNNAATPIHKGGRAIVVGGGNVAMDSARTARRMGAEVTVVYRRSMDELPARREEIEHAIEEGIEFALLTNPTAILGYTAEDAPSPDKIGSVKGIRLVRMELGEPDASGRRRPLEVANSEFTLECDTVIISIGTTPNPLIRKTTDGLAVNRRGCLVVEEETGKTTRDAVYAGGDAVTGAATVISAMGAGKRAAAAIHEFLMNK